MKLINLQQRSEEWFEYRKKKIMASEAPIILGVSPYKTIEELEQEKVFGSIQQNFPWMQRGIDLEPFALHMFERETGLTMFPCVGEHENGWMAASFDGMTLDEDVVVEIKCPGKKDHQLALEGKIPEKYIPQLQHQLYVSGLEIIFYFSFDGSNGIILECRRNDDFINYMIEKEFEFWQIISSF